MLSHLYANVWGGMRAAVFRRTDAKSFAVSPQQLILIAVLVFGFGVVLNRSFFDGPMEFNWQELRAHWFDVPVLMLAGWLAAHVSGRRVNPLLIPVVLFAAALTVDAVLALAWHVVMSMPRHMVPWAWAGLYYAEFVWLLLIAAVLMRRLVRLDAKRSVLAMLPLFALTALDIVYPPAQMWVEPSPEQADVASTEKRDSPVAEEMLYLQPRITEQAIKALLPQRRGIADLYFVGFAPYASEDVFLKESEAIRTLMDERFDTRGRSLLLVNNSKVLRKYPLATATNLRAALARVGKLINKEEDAVVVYMTSHGSKQHRLSSDYWPLELTELDPASLKQAFDDAGIKWRVVIVSACYSGGFIEPLRTPTTLIMTAADATHTSFGCGSQSDFTYFGKALFDEQLRQTHSFEEAFTRAAPLIKEREKGKQDGFSNPQIAVGDAMRIKLAEIERRLDALSKRR